MSYRHLHYDDWPEPWWTIAFTVTEDFWEALMDINYVLGLDLTDTTGVQ